MHFKKELKYLFAVISIFLLVYFLPVGTARFDSAIIESLALAKWYAREHVLLCLIPAFFIAGAIAVFISQNAVMKYLGAKANKVLAYSVASVSGSILAVCSCTVLPLFAGIYKMGAGLGPATAFLYAGPAINVLAIILTARILGFELGIARAVGAIIFSIVIGLSMHFIFRKEESEKATAQANIPDAEELRPLWQNAIFFFTMVSILVFANWSNPQAESGFFYAIYQFKWTLTIALLVILAFFIKFFIKKAEAKEWLEATWGFTKQILPLLLMGVLVAGFLLGRPNSEGIIPSSYVNAFVGDNSIFSNLFASVIGAFMYFATLTEIPIIQGLVNNGMAKGPALALLLAGPALSLPNMLVIKSIMGIKKTMVFVLLVVIMATISGFLYGKFF